MKIHEFQAKELFKEYGIRTTNFALAETEEQISSAIANIGSPCVVKAQVHSGARGKNGGVKFCKTNSEAFETAKNMLGMEFRSNQLGTDVKIVRKIIVEKAVNIEKEYYLSFTIDRSTKSLAVIFSKCGGMDIEAIALEAPDKIVTSQINLNAEISIVDIINRYDIPTIEKMQMALIFERIIKLFVQKDCSLVEINPLAYTPERGLVALDAKINFDDSALFRHPEIAALRDLAEENPLDVEASKFGLNYIKLDGEIGCMVNGAGLAMATMDIIKLAGKSAANFLDVGGGASAEKIENAFKILMSDKSVKAVFINIFGGILRCDVLAEGIKNAMTNLSVDVPVIVRLEGTNKERGAEILNTSGLQFDVVKDLDDAALAIGRL